MPRTRKLDFAMLLVIWLCATNTLSWAESGILVVHVKDVQERPIAGIQIGVTGDGGSATTGDDGKARIRLAKQTKENDLVHLQILRSPPNKDFMMVSPWDYGASVPPFANESKNVVEIVVVQRADRLALVSGAVVKSLAEQINKANAPKTADKQAAPEDPKASLTAVAKRYELSPDDIDQAIRTWKTKDQYEDGLKALYERNYPKASAQFADSLHQREEKLAADQKADQKAVADAACFLGVSLYEEGRYRDAAEAYKRYLQLRPDDIVATSGLGQSLLLAGGYAAAEPLLKRATESLEKTQVSSPAPFVSSLNNLALLLKAKGQYAESEHVLRRALGIANETLAPDDPVLVTVVNSLAVTLKTEGKYKEAEPLYRRVEETDERVSGPDSVNVANSQYNLAQLLVAEGDYAGAEPRFRRALGIVEKALPPSHPHIADCLRSLGETLLAEGNQADAEPLLKRARDIDEKTLGPDHPQLGFDLNDLASLLRDRHLYTEAEALSRRGLAIEEGAFGPDHPEVAKALNNLALLVAIRGDYAEAKALERQALTIQEKTLGPDHPQTQQTRRNLQALIDEESSKKTGR